MIQLRFLLPLMLLAACSTQPVQAPVLEDPSGLDVSVNGTSATLTWQDNCNSEEGYYVFIGGGGYTSKPVATLPADSREHTFQNLEPGVEYRFGVQAFGKGSSLSKAVYTDPVRMPEPEPEPEPDPNPIEPVTFTWTAVPNLDLPQSVAVYQTTATLNGRPLQAWYAIASPKEVAVRVLNPGDGKKATIDKQATDAGNCLVLINGGIFGSRPNGFAICDGEQTPWFRVEADNWDVDRQYWGPEPNADGQLHTVSRGLFGVDASGTPGVYWSYTPSHGTVYVYDQPIPSVEGEPVLGGGTDTYPCPRASWVPYNAITCGPVLLHKGKCPINDKKTAKGYWATNYEMWASDIFGVNERHDRTAVGYLADGRVILLIADGRISASQGATTLEMAAIMKGLGCVGALNLDGGGSTGMWAAGQHLNDLTGGNRAVMTTIGFFKK